MSDSKLFKYACYVLAATLLVPVAVYAASMVFGFSGQDPAKYIAEGKKSVLNQVEKKEAPKKSDDKKSDKKTSKKSSDKKVVKESTKKADKKVSKKSVVTGKKASTYTVKSGDTYGCIAEKYYGSLELWPVVYNANIGGGVGYGEYDLHVGAVLVLPAVSASNMAPASNLCK